MSAFPGQIVVTGEATPDATGAFEVNVMPAAGGSHLVHSKIGGQGHVVCPQPLHDVRASHPPPPRRLDCPPPRALGTRSAPLPAAPHDPVAHGLGLTPGCSRGGIQIGVDDSKEKLQKIIDSIRQLL